MDFEQLGLWITDQWIAYRPPVWLCILSATFYAYYTYSTWNFGIFRRLGIKGPRPIPVLGTMMPILSKGFLEHDVDMRKYGKVVGTFQGREPAMIIYDVDILKSILVKDFNSFQNRFAPDEFFSYPMRRMLTVLKGEHWKHVRNTLTPTFSTGKLRRMQQQIEKCAECLISNLQQKADNDDIFDFRQYCGAYTMDVIASTAFSLQIDSHNDPNNQFVRMSNKLFNFSFADPKVAIFLFCPFLAKPLSKLGITFFPTDVRDFFVNTVNQAMKQRQLDTDENKRTDFLQLMVNARIDDINSVDSVDGTTVEGTSGLWSRKGITHEEIVAQGLLFFVAGYETTANTLSLFAYCMAVNSDCQDKLIAEVDEVMKGQDHVTYDLAHSMPYLDRCLMETQRLYPVGPRADRVADEDVTINGVFIPKGMTVIIPIYALHMDPEVWPDPHKFNPDRFLPEETAARNPYYYQPYGTGPRNCIGMRLALTEMKMAIVHILTKFRFVACEQTEIPLKLSKTSVRAANGVKIKVQARETPQ
jgi:cytochrome P450 family 3 subfamily A